MLDDSPKASLASPDVCPGIGLTVRAALSLFPFPREDGTLVTGHHQPRTSSFAPPKATGLPVTKSFLARALKIIFSEP